MSDNIDSTPSALDAGDNIERRYYLSTVEKIADPTVGESGTWCRYVIEGGYAPLIGHRKGTKKQITEYAEQYAQELNERHKFGPAMAKGRPKKRA